MSHQYLEVDPKNQKTIWERFNEWSSSPYHLFDFMRDASDTSGFVTVRSMYDLAQYATNNWPANIVPLLFCCSKYTKQVAITYNSGYVTNIQMQNS